MVTGIPMDTWADAGPRAVVTAWQVIEDANRKRGGTGA